MTRNENKTTEIMLDVFYDADLPDKSPTTAEDFDVVISGPPEGDPKPDPEKGNEDGGNGDDKGDQSGEEGKDPEKEPEPASTEETPKAQKAEDVRVAKDGTLEIAEDARLVIGGKPVLHKELVKAYVDNEKFVASNTQKAMDVAESKKAMDKDLLVIGAYKGLVDAVKGSDDVLASLKEHFSDKPEVIKAIEAAVSADPIKAAKPYEDEITALRADNKGMKEERLFSTERSDMIKKNQLSEEDMKGVEKIILDKYNKTQIPLSLEDGLELWQAKQIIASNGKAKTPKPPEQGAKTKTQTTKSNTARSSNRGDKRTTAEDFDVVHS